MIADLKQFIGKGLYTVPEAAFYGRMQRKLLRRWVFGDSAGGAVITPQMATDAKFVTFIDFVQTLAIRPIRLKRRVKLSKIRQAVAFARQHWGMEYPFAMKHTTYLWGDEIVIVPPQKDKEDARLLVEASGKHKGNILLEQVVELYLEDLDFDAAGVADSYTIFPSGGVNITMNPHRRFGDPLLPSGYSARTIWEAVPIEGGIGETARAFGIQKKRLRLP